VTALERRVRRVIPLVRDYGHARPLVILLHPPTASTPAELEVRELGRRKGPRISIARLYTMLARNAAGLPAPRGRKARRLP
jgi:hypothetical protein